MGFLPLTDRSILEISGEDAEGFLDNILTCKIVGLEPWEASFGALLTPQGKILFDFFVIRTTNGYWLDTLTDLSDELLKRLTFYRLRAKVILSKLDTMTVSASIGDKRPDAGKTVADPRHSAMGYRVYSDESANGDHDAYLQQRLSICMPEGGKDFQYGEAYPHEVLMDQFGGVDFKKGCYVGQEVVSRMQHRGTAKKRIIKVFSDTNLPSPGTPITADGKPAGTLGSTSQTNGLALLRLDRVVAAEHLDADGIALRTELPDWVTFTWPETP